MVSLEEKANYQRRIENVPQLNNFYRFLVEGIEPSGSSGAEIDELVNGFLSALAKNNKQVFEDELSKISKRNPVSQSQSPFVNVDILIFSIILGVNKYKLDSTWVKKTVGIRSESAITTTFRNLLNHNFNDLNNLPEIILVHHLCTSGDLTGDLFKATYRSIVTKVTNFPGKSDFENICQMVAYDTIITQKSFPETVYANQLRIFNEQFLKRIKVIAYLVTIVLIFGVTWTVFQLLQLIPAVAKIVEDLSWIGGLLWGVSIAGSIIAPIRLAVFRLTLRGFGYPKDLTNQIQV